MADVKINTLPMGCCLQEYQLKKILGIGGLAAIQFDVVIYYPIKVCILPNKRCHSIGLGS